MPCPMQVVPSARTTLQGDRVTYIQGDLINSPEGAVPVAATGGVPAPADGDVLLVVVHALETADLDTSRCVDT